MISGVGYTDEMFVSSSSSPYLLSISWDGEVNTNKSWKFNDFIDRPITGILLQVTLKDYITFQLMWNLT